MYQAEVSYPVLTNFFKALDRGNATVAFLGDSTTAFSSLNENYSHPEYLQEWFDTTYGVGKVTVINAGWGGNDLTLMSNRLARDVINKEPDCVIISSGWNDINKGTLGVFEYRYNLIVELIKVSSKKPVDIVLRTQNYSTDSSSMGVFEEQVNPMTIRVAKNNKVQLIDLFYHMKREYQEENIVLDPSLPNTLNADTTHPNKQGCIYIGDFLKPMFDKDSKKISKQSDESLYWYDGVYVEATNTSLVTTGGYSVVVQEGNTVTKDIRYRSLAAGNGFYNRKASFHFYGKYVKVVFQVGENRGKVNISIDGGTPVKVDTYEHQGNGQPENFKIVEFTDLTDAPHTITVENLNEKHPDATNDIVVFNGFIVQKEGFYAFNLTNVKRDFYALGCYNASDKATKTTTIAPNGSGLLEIDSYLLNGNYVNTTDKTITVTHAGIYHINGTASIAPANNQGHLNLLRNGGHLAQNHFNVNDSNAVDKILRISTIAQLNEGDKISFRILNMFTSDNITINNYGDTSRTSLTIALVK